MGGSFNPPTLAHMLIGSEIMQRNLSDLLLYVPCAHRSDKWLFESKEHRLQMLKLSIQNHFKQLNNLVIKTQNNPDLSGYRDRVVVDTHEIDLYREMLPTKDLFRHYQRVYPNITFQFVIGSDLLDSLEHWEGYHDVLRSLEYIVFERGGYAIDSTKLPVKSTIISMDEVSFISSTEVRQLIQQNPHDVQPAYKQLEKLVCQDTAHYIIEKSLYLN